MSLLTFVVAFLPQTADHSALHPEGVDLYFEVPDVPALLDGYDAAPLLKTLREEPVRDLLGAVGVEASHEPRAALRALLLRLDLAPELAELALAVKRVSLSLGAPAEDAAAVGATAVLDFTSPEAAQGVLAALRAEGAETADAAAAWARCAAPGGIDVELHGCVRDGRLVLLGGTETPAAFDARLEAGVSDLSQDTFYRAGWSQLGEGAGVTVVRAMQRRSPLQWLQELDAADQFGRAEGFSVPEAFDPLRGARHWRMQLRDGRFVTEAFARDAGERTGPFGHRDLDAAGLERVPEGVMFVYAGTVDGPRLAPLVQRALGDGAEEMAVDLERLFSKLGPSLVAYAFAPGGIGLPPAFAWVSVSDAEAFEAALAPVLDALAERYPGTEARTRDYRLRAADTGERIAIPVTTLALPKELLQLGPLITITPTWAIVDGQVLLGLSSMTLKRELKRLYGEKAETAGAHVLRSEGFALPADGVRSVIVMDWGRLIRGVLETVRALAGMMGDRLPIDLNELPSGQTITKHMRPTFHYSRLVEGGELRVHEASFGPETWFGMAAAALGFGLVDALSDD